MTDPAKNAPHSTSIAIRSDLLWMMLGLSVILGATLAVAHYQGELPALKAAGVAAFIVGQAVVLAYLVTVLSSSASAAGALAGIGLRTGLPMAALLFISESSPALADAGFGKYLLMCYLPSLALETCLVARRLSRMNKSGPSSLAGDSTVSSDSPQAV